MPVGAIFHANVRLVEIGTVDTRATGCIINSVAPFTTLAFVSFGFITGKGGGVWAVRHKQKAEIRMERQCFIGQAGLELSS
jgi:hypothetical protein